jgi:hypothetical protein
MLRSYLLRVTAIFILLFILSFSFGYSLLPDAGKFTAAFFEWLSRATAGFLGIDPGNSRIVSDSASFYVAVLNAFVVAMIIGLVWSSVIKSSRTDGYVREGIYITARYYLALHLLIYGCSKLFKAQFYLPEPNTLFTPLGQLHQDLLYWSTMGVSRPYNIFLGISEIIAGMLFFSRRTTFAASLFSLFILTNVMAVNLSFDISVKLFTAFLLFLTCWLLWKERQRVLQLFGYRTERPLIGLEGFAKGKWRRPVKVLVILLFLLEATWPYLKKNSWNDDSVERPALHGAYRVTNFILNGDTIAALQSEQGRWKNFFVHREGYFIIQSMDDRFIDYDLVTDTITHHITITDTRNNDQFILLYQKSTDSTIHLNGILKGAQLEVDASVVDMNSLPLLRREFHWTDDQ